MWGTIVTESLLSVNKGRVTFLRGPLESKVGRRSHRIVIEIRSYGRKSGSIDDPEVEVRSVVLPPCHLPVGHTTKGPYYVVKNTEVTGLESLNQGPGVNSLQPDSLPRNKTCHSLFHSYR